MADAPPPEMGPRHALVTHDDQGAVLSIAIWFLMVAMILSVILRLTIRFTTAHIPGKDDAIAFASMCCSIGAVIALSLGVNHGLGRRLDLLNHTQVLDVEMYAYTSTILYLATLSLAKMSMLVFIARLTLTKTHLIVIRIIGLIVTLWSLASIFAVAFECGVPRPWDYMGGKCFSPVAFWNIIGTVDILTDVALIVLPVCLVWTLQMSSSKKAVVITAFSFRVIVIAAAICRLVYLSILEKSTDPTYESVTYHICTACQESISVIVACIPTLKPFMDRVASGMLNVSLAPRAPGTTYGPQDSYELKNMSKTSGKEVSGASQTHHSARAWRPDMVGYKSVVSTPSKWLPHQAKKKGETASVETNGSDQMIIRQTTDWNVHYDTDQGRDSNASPA